MAVWDCIIIGSGFSGLSAARTLVNAGFSPLVLEARNRLGGRAYTIVEDGHGEPVDTGCAQIHGYLEGNPMKTLNAELGLPPAHVVQDAQTLVIGSDSSSEHIGSNALEPATALEILSSAAKAFPMAPPYPLPTASESLATLYLPKIRSLHVQSAARMTEIGAGIALESISARWWGYGRAYAGTDGAPVGGYSRIIQALAAEIESRNSEAGIKLNEEVVAIKRSLDGRETGVEVRTCNGGIYKAKTCICTIPLGVLKTSPPTFAPPLDDVFLATIKRTSVGILEKVILSYETTWWPQSTAYDTYILLSTVQASSPPSYDSLASMFAHTPLAVSNLARTALKPHPTLLVYIGAAAGQYVSKFSPEEVSDALHTYLVSRLNPHLVPLPPKPKHFTVTEWLTDPYSRGATSSPVSLTTVDNESASPLDFITLSRSTWSGTLGFAGEHTDLDGRGSVVGALVSGEREGKRVAALLEREGETNIS